MSSVKEGTPLYTALLKLCSFGSHEAHEHLEVACQNTGNGIFAKQNIGAGERLFVFPFSEAIKPHGKIMEFVQKGMCSPIIGLVLTAMHELFVQKDKAPYWKYLLSLTPPNIGHCWNEEEKMFFELLFRLSKEECNMLIEIVKKEKVILGVYGFKESMLVFDFMV